ncbi:MAG: V-type ATPase 116kDa subunit family protein, partial [Candidatus Bathyarchaeia archaeon]
TALGNPMWFILVALLIGLIHVNLAHLLATVKGIRERQNKLVLGKIGLFLLEIGGIPLIMHVIFHVNIPFLPEEAYSILMYVAAAGIVLIAASSIMLNGFLGAMFWIFDITGLLGDVMSYCRLAGVGLATYYLAMCFNLMATLLSGMVPVAVRAVLGPLLAILILVIGHVINLLLAGIACFAHSLRLCFVEFLLKFYEGTGREYRPFQLRRQAALPAGGKA